MPPTDAAPSRRRAEPTSVDATPTSTRSRRRAATRRRSDAKPILEVENLRMYFPVKSSGPHPPHRRPRAGRRRRLLRRSPRAARSGWSASPGCGKSTTGRLITRLYEPTGGSIKFEGNDIAQISAAAAQAAAPRDPDDLPGPLHLAEPAAHGRLDRRRAAARSTRSCPRSKSCRRVQELLEIVGLNPEHYNRYPNEFSGGQRQRIGIARALTLSPSCSSPTSRSPRSTCRSRRRWSTCCRTCSRSSTSRSSSSPTTSRSCGTSAPRSR